MRSGGRGFWQEANSRGPWRKAVSPLLQMDPTMFASLHNARLSASEELLCDPAHLSKPEHYESKRPAGSLRSFQPRRGRCSAFASRCTGPSGSNAARKRPRSLAVQLEFVQNVGHHIGAEGLHLRCGLTANELLEVFLLQIPFHRIDARDAQHRGVKQAVDHVEGGNFRCSPRID